MKNYSPSVALWFFILTSTFCLLYCGENEIQASLISSASAGATPAPATNDCPEPRGEVIQLPDCKSGVIK